MDRRLKCTCPSLGESAEGCGRVSNRECVMGNAGGVM